MLQKFDNFIAKKKETWKRTSHRVEKNQVEHHNVKCQEETTDAVPTSYRRSPQRPSNPSHPHKLRKSGIRKSKIVGGYHHKSSAPNDSPPLRLKDLGKVKQLESEIFKKEREALESKSGEGSGDKLPFDPLQLDLAEALHDSPFLHEKLLAMEESVHALVSKLNGILKLAKGMQKHSQMYIELSKHFSQELITFTDGSGSQEADPLLELGLKKFGGAFQEIAEFSSLLNHQLEFGFINPLEEFLRNDVKRAKEFSRKYERFRSSCEEMAVKSRSLKSKGTEKFDEYDEQLQEARRNLQNATLELAFELNTFQAKKKIEFLERVCTLMRGEQAFFHQGYMLGNELEEYMQELVSHLQLIRAEVDEGRKQLDEHKIELQKVEIEGTHYEQPLQLATKISGYLFKKSRNMRKEWKRRYFRVERGKLFMFKPKEKTMFPLARLLLSAVKDLQDSERRFCFEIVSPHSSCILQAESPHDHQAWITVLHNAIEDELHQRKTSGQLTDRPRQSIPPAQVLHAVRAADSGNLICADCGALDPSWGVSNLGLVICLECSGVHRGLGRHISKVRSLTLDAWEPEALRLMLALGNARVNSILEHTTGSSSKPEPHTPRIERESWIQNKYVGKQFIAADLAGPDELGERLIGSVKEGDLAHVLYWILHGANVNYTTVEHQGMMPLHYSVCNDFLDGATLLLQNGADVNAVDERKWSALHHCAALGHTHCVALLFKHGARVDLADLKGKTPVDVALAAQHADIVTLLRLAILSIEERTDNSGTMDDSFSKALACFSVPVSDSDQNAKASSLQGWSMDDFLGSPCSQPEIELCWEQDDTAASSDNTVET